MFPNTQQCIDVVEFKRRQRDELKQRIRDAAAILQVTAHELAEALSRSGCSRAMTGAAVELMQEPTA